MLFRHFILMNVWDKALRNQRVFVYSRVSNIYSCTWKLIRRLSNIK